MEYTQILHCDCYVTALLVHLFLNFAKDLRQMAEAEIEKQKEEEEKAKRR